MAANLLLDDIRKDIDKKKLVGALFLDLSKAFDTISHKSLLTKFQATELRGKPPLEAFSF